MADIGGLRDYLDSRFRTCDEDGVYYAHQPIYGFRGGRCEPDLFDRYIRTDQILRALSTGPFQTLLDVGAAEGYKAHLAHRFRGLRVTASDLSGQACRRAAELFSIPSVAADARHLPFGREAFDVVLCSETLEHLPDWEVALRELLRVARMAVVVTVPHEPEAAVRSIRDRSVRFGHVSRFELGSLDHLRAEGHVVVARRLIARRLRLPQVLVEAVPRRHHGLTRYPPALFDAYNAVL
ncbi:MAG TPA: class I SAM-dependent methyltransferase, partial [Candidatus Dormibacteraeota bacterium]|nr:class I SAM-dependent methyltransferase [Candidatus Dormibacteraeota bacterium]